MNPFRYSTKPWFVIFASENKLLFESKIFCSKVLKEAKDSISSVKIAAHKILVGSLDCSVRQYDLRTGEVVSDFVGGKSWVFMLVCMGVGAHRDGGDEVSSGPKVPKVKWEEDMEWKSLVCRRYGWNWALPHCTSNRYVYFILTRLFVPMRMTVRRNDVI